MEHLEDHQRPNATIVAGPRDAGRTYLAAHPNPFETLTVAELPATWRVVIARHLGEADRRRSVTLKREARVRPTPVSGPLVLLAHYPPSPERRAGLRVGVSRCGD